VLIDTSAFSVPQVEAERLNSQVFFSRQPEEPNAQATRPELTEALDDFKETVRSEVKKASDDVVQRLIAERNSNNALSTTSISGENQNIIKLESMTSKVIGDMKKQLSKM
jgi:hypothetical protein